MAVVQVPCKFCTSDAVVHGVCASCGQHQTPRRPRVRGRQSSAVCKHRHWKYGPPTYIGGAYVRTDKCVGCGKTRQVEP